MKTNFNIKISILLLFMYCQKYCVYHIMEVVIFYADKLVTMGSSKNLRVFNFAILLQLQVYLRGYTGQVPVCRSQQKKSEIPNSYNM